jgi:hypothetical protein
VQQTIVIETLKKMFEGYDCTAAIEKTNQLLPRYKTLLQLAQRIAKGEKINIERTRYR